MALWLRPRHIWGRRWRLSLRATSLYARAAGFTAQIEHMRNCVSYFDQFLGEIKDPAAVTADDFRRYLVYLSTKPVWKGPQNEQSTGTKRYHC